MRVSVVIPARDVSATIGGALDALREQDLGEPFEVIVVDNGSRDGTRELAERHPVVDRVVRRPRGEGPGAARNDGVAAASAPVVAFTDADCVPSRGWLRERLAALEDADLAQGKVLPVEGAAVGPFDHSLWVTFEYGLYETANLFVLRTWFERVGGSQDWINADRRDGAKPERPFGEDALFAWRVRRLGARTTFSERAVVRHAVFPGTARQYLCERLRDRHFATLGDLIPELRDVFFYRRYFLSRRSDAFAFGVAATAAAALARSPLPLTAWIPWTWLLRRESERRTRVPSRRVAATVAAGDAAAFVGLLGATLRGRGPLL